MVRYSHRPQIWQVQEAKARFSALVRDASTQGPQTITVHGRRAAVVLSPEDYDRLKGGRISFAEFLARSPLAGVDLDLERDRSLPRDVEL
ncbi:MAG: type II toxin-antitoxin system Phd/YefM family antitoxin [Acidobacteria bacterium]|nr:type II toxin-antitoxin system Phd/YefM family antitoxin [Acidobacteriota bacterium]